MNGKLIPKLRSTLILQISDHRRVHHYISMPHGFTFTTWQWMIIVYSYMLQHCSFLILKIPWGHVSPCDVSVIYGSPGDGKSTLCSNGYSNESYPVAYLVQLRLRAKVTFCGNGYYSWKLSRSLVIKCQGLLETVLYAEISFTDMNLSNCLQ